MHKGGICTAEMQHIRCSSTVEDRKLTLGLGRKMAVNTIPQKGSDFCSNPTSPSAEKETLAREEKGFFIICCVATQL